MHSPSIRMTLSGACETVNIIILYIKGAEKFGKKFKKFLPPMRSICLGTQVQF